MPATPPATPPETLQLPDHLRGRIIEHCLAALPNEGCGFIASDEDGRVVAVYPTANADPSPVTYTVPPAEHYAALTDADAHGWELAGVFHSHPDGPAEPSPTDLASALDRTWTYLVVALSPEPVIRAWRIRDGEAREVSLG
jgi:proteasome lid subunit RPN8/RPN11